MSARSGRSGLGSADLPRGKRIVGLAGLWATLSAVLAFVVYAASEDPIAVAVTIALCALACVAGALLTAPDDPARRALWQAIEADDVGVALEQPPSGGRPAQIVAMNAPFQAIARVQPGESRAAAVVLAEAFEADPVAEERKSAAAKPQADGEGGPTARARLFALARGEWPGPIRLGRNSKKPEWVEVNRQTLADGTALWRVATVSGDRADASAGAIVGAGAARRSDAGASGLSAVLDAAPFGLALVAGGEADGWAILESNATLGVLTGAEITDATKLPDLFAPEEAAAIADFLEKSVAVDQVGASLNLQPRAKPDDVITLGARVVRSEAGGGATGGRRILLVHATDATERRRLEMQFAQSQKMQALGQLAGGVAHDFNNMLTAIIGFCDLLLHRHQEGDQTFADVMQINQNAKRAARLVRQLLAFSRQQPLQPTLVNVTDTLAEISSLLRRVLGERVTLDLMHGRELGLIRADQSQLEQMIINLAVNARDAMENNGVLTITTERRQLEKPSLMGGETAPAGVYVAIVVADTGPGVPEENLEKIFDPFFTTKEIGAGTGLGLSMVYGGVQQNGGFISVENRSGAETGAIFTLLLPQAATQEESVEADGAEAAGSGADETDDVTGGGDILLVEDEDAVRTFGARALRSKGYVVTEARTGATALDILAGERFDLLITDMMMPEVDGATLIKEARKNHPDLPVICISGYTEEAVAAEVAAFDDLHFLPKPFSLKQLASMVKKALETG